MNSLWWTRDRTATLTRSVWWIVVGAGLASGCAHSAADPANWNPEVPITLPEPDPPGAPESGAWSAYERDGNRHRVQTTWVDVDADRASGPRAETLGDLPRVRVRVTFAGPGPTVLRPPGFHVLLEHRDGGFDLGEVEDMEISMGDGRVRSWGVYESDDVGDRTYRHLFFQVWHEDMEALASGEIVSCRVGEFQFTFPRRFFRLAREVLDLAGTQAGTGLQSDEPVRVQSD